ncbi:Uncharacterized protein APZ42_026646 [Daphnia magna]|uniref:CxC3 like cysteine cluster domain-containing protein n=1 Tax=Daphnia magna TaxID=35525 RepID=A0A162ECU9_9CRUS|nr:Uncharacterized protein APZ42_026646 [Daphnia magna]
MKISKYFVPESVDYQTEVPKIFPVEFTKELIGRVHQFTEKEFPDERGKSKTKEKKIVEDDIERGSDVTMVETAYKAVFEVYGSVPVPLFPAGPCPECSKIGVLGMVVVTSNSSSHWFSVVTKDGVFELNAPVYRCNQRTTCNYNREVRLEDFMSCGYFPGNPNKPRFMFSTKLLQMWHHVSLLTPGTSLTQFSNALSSTSQDAGLRFQTTSKAYAYVNHLIDKCVKVIKKRWCRSCTSEITEELEPHSALVDGNLKLCRRSR